MESTIKWQTGTPNIPHDRYIITTKWKEITVDWYDKDLGWFKYSDEEIIAWCPLSDIKPYKE